MPNTKSKARTTVQNGAIYVQKVRGMGRGVFASRPFRSGEVIEICPVVLLPGITDENQLGGMKNYVFLWCESENVMAIALGYGSLYNHDSKPNAKFTFRVARNEIVFRAVRHITPGEQILIDYGWDEADYSVFRRTV
jgi:uncharacterized protein